MNVSEDLTKQVMTFVIRHPGTKLVAVEEALGVSRIEVGRTLRALMDQGKIRRDEETRQYFPV